MNDQEVRDGLASLVVDEPPLDFDPDALIARADANARRRRILASAGGATVAIAAVAVVLPIALRGQEPTDQATPGSGAAISTAPTIDFVWPPAHFPTPDYSAADIEAKAHDLQQRAKFAFPDVVHTVTSAQVDLFTGEAEGDYRDGQLTLNGVVHFTAKEGKAAVVIQVDAGATNPSPQAVCAQENREDCKVQVRPDGSALLVTHIEEGRYEIETVRHYRTDGVVVAVSGYNADEFSGNHTPYLPKIPVTDEQLTALATNGGFTL